MVRFPALFRRLVAFANRRLSNPRSRLRRALLRRANISGWAALSRRDFKLRRAFFTSDVESELPPEPQTLGLTGTFRGYEAIEQALDEWADGWGASELVPAYILDLGDRLLLLGFYRARGQASGLELEQEFAQLLTLREGLASRDQFWFQWEEGLRAAGLDPDAIALPRRRKAGQVASSN